MSLNFLSQISWQFQYAKNIIYIPKSYLNMNLVQFRSTLINLMQLRKTTIKQNLQKRKKLYFQF